MIPLFKSHFSVGKSILTLAEPEKQKEDGPDSIISIALENGLKEVFLVEDSFTGFLSAFNKGQREHVADAAICIEIARRSPYLRGLLK